MDKVMVLCPGQSGSFGSMILELNGGHFSGKPNATWSTKTKPVWDSPIGPSAAHGDSAVRMLNYGPIAIVEAGEKNLFV